MGYVAFSLSILSENLGPRSWIKQIADYISAIHCTLVSFILEFGFSRVEAALRAPIHNNLTSDSDFEQDLVVIDPCSPTDNIPDFVDKTVSRFLPSQYLQIRGSILTISFTPKMFRIQS
jgi:hypothetical protein